MNSQDFVKFALQISVMLGFAILFGQFMRRIKQPAVLGEMIGGIILGPTIFGLLAPDLWQWLFKSSANVTEVRDASIKLGMLFFLFISGLETNLSDLTDHSQHYGRPGDPRFPGCLPDRCGVEWEER